MSDSALGVGLEKIMTVAEERRGSGVVAPEKFLGDHALWSFGNAQSEHTETGIAFIPKT